MTACRKGVGMETTTFSRNGFLGLGAAIGLVLATAAPIGAEDVCRTNCDNWLATCLQDCANAPVVAECRANCRAVDRMCLDNCD